MEPDRASGRSQVRLGGELSDHFVVLIWAQHRITATTHFQRFDNFFRSPSPFWKAAGSFLPGLTPAVPYGPIRPRGSKMVWGAVRFRLSEPQLIL